MLRGGRSGHSLADCIFVWRSAQRVALYEIYVDILVSTLTGRGRHQRDRLDTLRREKQGYFSENPKQDQRGSSLGRIHDVLPKRDVPPRIFVFVHSLYLSK